MYLPPLQPVLNSDIRICGDVEIHPSASIAPGVVLQAASNGRIVIGADACIGMGVIVSAYDGTVAIDSGATLGSGVLVVGYSHIGSNACVGTATTVINTSVDSMAVITPGSIIGDVSRPEEKVATSLNNSSTSEEEKNLAESNNFEEDSKDNVENNQDQIEEVKQDLSTNEKPDLGTNRPDLSGDPWQEEKVLQEEAQESENTQEHIVDLAIKEVKQNLKLDDNTTIGKVYIDELLVTLFPHKKHFNNNDKIK